MKKVLLMLLIGTTILFSCAFTSVVYLDHRYVRPSAQQLSSFFTDMEVSKSFTKEPTLSDTYFANIDPQTQPKLHGWIPVWGMKDALKKLEEKKHIFETVSPVFYHIDIKGEVTTQKSTLPQLKEVLKGSNVKILPTISSFEAEGMGKVLESPDKLQAHVNFLLKEIDENQFDGLDLNHESINKRYKEEYFQLIQKLAEGIKARGKLFSITVLAKWGDNLNYGSPQTREVQDYSRLAQYCDHFRIMTYDYTSQKSKNPGPIAPIRWMEQVLDYAVKRVPKEKLILGAHLYAYVWPDDTTAKALEFYHISDIKINNPTAQMLYNKDYEEAAIRYTAEGKTQFGYYASPESIQARLNLAKKYGIQGLSFWRIGRDAL